MKGFLIKWGINIIALVAVMHIVPGINVDRWETAIITALVLGLINAFLKPFIILFALPLYIFSLGLATFFVNAALFYLVSRLVAGFHIVHFWNAFWGALVFSIISFMLNLLISPRGRVNVKFRDYRSGRNPGYRDAIDVEGKVVDDDKEKIEE